MKNIKMNNNLRTIIAGASIVAAMAGNVPAQSEAAKPNVLFIAVDDLNDFPKFMGHYPDAITPNLDRLAARGTAFLNAYSQFPLCGPSRASIMSGMQPSTLGFDHHMQDKEVQKRAQELGSEVLNDCFKRQGYTTLAVGKIFHHHVPENSVDASGGRGDFQGDLGRLKANWPQKGTQTDWAMAPERDDQLPDYHAAEWAVKQLQADHEKPFLLMVGFLRPHVPWYVPKKWFDLYDKDKLTLPPYKKDDLKDVPKISRELNIAKAMPSTEWAIENDQWRNMLQAYLACISFADHQVGKVLDALDASPYKDNTVIVLWSDHGYHMGEKGTFQKHSLWERAAKSPLIFAGPNVAAEQRCEQVVSLIDIYPTLLELCGLPANPKNEGHSLVPLLNDPEKEWPYPALTGWKSDSFAVQSGRYRYIRYSDGSEELYDHEKDLNEWTNLANNPEYRATMDEMAKYLPDMEAVAAAKEKMKHNKKKKHK